MAISKLILILPAILFAGIAGCGPSEEMEVTSPSFEDGDIISAIHTGVEDNLSPELNWEKVPEGAESFALICEDPDAPRGTFIHWVIYNIPGERRKLASAIPPKAELEDGTLQGLNDFGKIGYSGPFPPPGKHHRYYFILYALDEVLDIESGLNAMKLRKAMKDHILAEGRFMGRFAR